MAHIPAPANCSQFDAMRADLVARGLLTGDFRLTAAGHAHTEQLIAELAATEIDPDFTGTQVRWNFNVKVPA